MINPWLAAKKAAKDAAPAYVAGDRGVFVRRMLKVDLGGDGALVRAKYRDDPTVLERLDAIAAFEETLVTPNSRFDKWLKGDQKALSKDELEGYKLFRDSGCVACHNGPNLGGNSFQKMGVVQAYKTASTAEGRKGVTGKDADRLSFKVPTLRNIELTYPYFHDGAAETMTQAVDLMGRLQLGREFSKDENAKIVAFLKTLTGQQPQIALPIMPPSTDKTPKPRPFN